MTHLKTQSLKTMSKPDKAFFLSMDLIERMIRVEQSVSASFNKHVSMKQTAYYKNLSPRVKSNFDEYMKRKSHNKILLYCLFFCSLIVASLFNVSLTGNVIAENLGYSSYQIFNMVVMFVLGVTAITVILSIIANKHAQNKFREKSKILEDVLVHKKHTIKKSRK